MEERLAAGSAVRIKRHTEIAVVETVQTRLKKSDHSQLPGQSDLRVLEFIQAEGNERILEERDVMEPNPGQGRILRSKSLRKLYSYHQSGILDLEMK